MKTIPFLPSEAGPVQFSDGNRSWRVDAYFTEPICTADRKPITSYLMFNHPITGVVTGVYGCLGTFMEISL
jgi:hypothetical protein